MGWGYRDFVIERWGFGGAGLTCCYEDIEVLYTWDGDVEILYRGVGFWLGRDSPVAIRM